MIYFGGQRGIFSKVVLGFRNFRYDFEGVREMFVGDSADMSARKCPLESMGGRAEGLACADPGGEPPLALADICCS